MMSERKGIFIEDYRGVLPVVLKLPFLKKDKSSNGNQQKGLKIY